MPPLKICTMSTGSNRLIQWCQVSVYYYWKEKVMDVLNESSDLKSDYESDFIITG